MSCNSIDLGCVGSCQEQIDFFEHVDPLAVNDYDLYIDFNGFKHCEELIILENGRVGFKNILNENYTHTITLIAKDGVSENKCFTIKTFPEICTTC